MSDASAYYVCDPVFHYPAAVGKTVTFYAIYAPAEEAGVYASWGDVVAVQMLVGKKNVDCQGFDNPEDVLSSFHGVCRRVHRHLSPPRPQPGVLYFNLDYFYNTFNPSLPPHKRYRKPVQTMPSPAIPPAIAPPPAASSTPSQGPGSSRAPHPMTAIRASTSSPSPIAAGVVRASSSSSSPMAARSAPSARASSVSSPSQYNTAPATSSQHRTPAAAASSTPSRAVSRTSSAREPAASVSAPPSNKDLPSSKKHRSSAHSQSHSKKHSRASSVATSSSYACADCSSWAEEAAAAMSNLDIQSVTSASSAHRSAASTDPWRSFVVGADGVQPMRFTSRREAQGACEALIHAGHRNAAVRKVESEEEERRLMHRFL